MQIKGTRGSRINRFNFAMIKKKISRIYLVTSYNRKKSYY